MKRWGDTSTYVAIIVGMFVVLGAGVAIGYAVHDDSSRPSAGLQDLRPSDIGNVAAGRRVFTSAGCVACHSYGGVGSKDGPPLDYMRGRLAVADLAVMTGLVWNHAPTMRKLFKEEGIPFPQFTGTEMADLMAYMHGGGPPPAARKGMMGGSMMGGG